MALPIEDYALIGDMQSAALIGRDGSCDWLCLPRFDSPACFAALLGDPGHGRWLLAPRGLDAARTKRRYRDRTLILETTFESPDGRVRVTDFMPPRDTTPDLVRIVEGLEGEVTLRMELAIRFDYGSVVPWVRRLDETRLHAIAGADGLLLEGRASTHPEGLSTCADFTVKPGQRVPFVLSWHPSHEPPPRSIDPFQALQETERWWREWASRGSYRGPWEQAVSSSLIVLKALTYAPTGGMVAAPTTSLPEHPGGVRNWDYRYCWLRDATYTLYSLTLAGYRQEAAAWRDWLLRAVAGDPSKLQIMYGLHGERRLREVELDWLPGYAGSTPVRVGNAAVGQLQLDVYGEVMDALHEARHAGLPPDAAAWRLQVALLEFLEGAWRRADEGIWEVRSGRQHFTHSKVMAWVAFDRAVKSARQLALDELVQRWSKLRDSIHSDVCTHAYDAGKRSFTQAYGSPRLDASLLLIPHVGFLPITDERVRGTIAAVERELLRDGLVMRYRHEGQDGLPPGEGTFLACSFWLADCYALMGRERDARSLFERLLSLRNDVGLLAEEFDPDTRRQLGNFPQAFSHVGVVNTAFNLTPAHAAPVRERSDGAER